MTDESSPEQYSELSTLLKELSGDLKKISELERLSQLEKLTALDKLDSIEKLEDLKLQDKVEKIEELVGKLDKLDQLDELKALSELIKLNQLDKLNQLESLFKLNELSKLDQLEKLRDLSKIDNFETTLSREGHRLDLLKNIDALTSLEKLTELSKLEALEKLERLSILENLQKLESLEQLTLLSKVDDFTQTLEKEGGKLIHLQKIDELKKLEKLDNLTELEKLNELSKLERLDRLEELTKLQKLDDFRLILEKEGYRLDELKKIDQLIELRNLEKLDTLKKLDSLSSLQELNKLEGLEKLNSAETQKTLDKLERLDKLDELKQLLDNKVLFVLKGLISIIVNIAGIAAITGVLFYGVFALDKQDKVTKLLPFLNVDEKIVSSFALKSLEGLLGRGEFKEVILNVKERLNKQINRYWDLTLDYSNSERYNMLESIRSMEYQSKEFPIKDFMQESMKKKRDEFRETLDRDFSRLKVSNQFSDEELKTLLSLNILTYKDQCEKAVDLMRSFDFSKIRETLFVEKLFLLNLDCLENSENSHSSLILELLKK